MLAQILAVPLLAMGAISAAAAPTQPKKFLPYFPDAVENPTDDPVDKRYLYCPLTNYRCFGNCWPTDYSCCQSMSRKGMLPLDLYSPCSVRLLSRQLLQWTQ